MQVDPLLLDVLPGAFLLVTPGSLEVRAVSRAYTRLTGLSASQIEGLPLLDLPTPHIADPHTALQWQDALRQSLTRMMTSRQADAMPVMRVNAGALPANGGPSRQSTRVGNTDLVLVAMNVPVLREDGSVRCIVHRVENIAGIRQRLSVAAADVLGATVTDGAHDLTLPCDVECEFDVLVALADRTRELERANRRLQLTQTLIQRTVDSAALGVVLLDPSHRIVLQNAAARELFRTSRVELSEKALRDLLHEADRPMLDAALAVDALAAGDHQWLELRPVWSTDDDAWMRFSIAAVDRADEGAYRLVLLEDISLSRRQQQQSRQQDTLLRIGGRMARVGGWAVDFQRNHVEWSREVAEVLEYPDTGAPPLDDALARTPAEWRPLLDEQLTRAASEGRPFDFELETITYAGRRIWIRVVGETERDDSGAIVRLVGALQDISEFKALQQSATANNRRLESTLEAMSDAFCILDKDWRFLYMNQEAARLMQRSRDELLGARVWDVFPDTVHTVVWDAFHRAMRDGLSSTFEMHYPALGHWFQVRAHPTDEGIAVHFQVIDDRKQAERTARSHAERFELVATASEAGIWDWQIARNSLHCSPRLKELLGGEPLPDLSSFRAFRALVHPDDQEAFDLALHAHLEHLTVFNVECRIRGRDESFRWFNVVGRAARDVTGRALRMVGSISDITRRRAAEDEVRNLAARLTATLESVTDAVFTLDREWRFGFLNSRAAQLLQRDASELVGRVVWDEFPDSKGSAVDLAYQRAMNDGVPVEFEQHYAAPSDRWFQVSAYPFDDGLVVYFRDVTQSHQATRALAASEERFRLLSKATNDAIWDWDLVSNALWWTEGYEALFGRARDAVAPTIDSWTDFIHPDDVQRTVDDINAVIEGGGDHWTGQYRYLRADGSYAWVLDRGYVIRDAQGVPMRMIGGMTDLTDRVMAEEQVAEQAALIDEASDAILVRDLQHRLTFWNEGASKVYGWTAEEAIGQHGGELLYADRGQFDRAMEELLRDGSWSGELEQVTKHGERRLVFGRWTLMRDRTGRPRSVLAINADITDRRLVEEQLLRAQRLESIGTLAGGIAHDLNNVLTPILMSIEVLKLSEENPMRLDVLSTIEASARRGADMVQQVLTFARGAEGEHTIVRLEDVVNDVVKIAQETFPRSIAVRATVSADVPPASADATQLHQVLLNLCVNARDAMPDGGTLRVGLTSALLDAHYVALHSEATAGEFVVLEVEDSGSGMTPEVLDKMFEPFFTTKGLGEGTGLGLSTTQAIVRSHGGFVRVYSEPGRGTTFHVYLPALPANAESGVVAPRVVELPRGRGELILVVDDEPSVRRITCHTLEAFGYRTMEAVDGADGIATFAAHQSDIALVLTDMMMPVMDGLRMVQVLRRMNPTLRVVAASGLQANNRAAKASEVGIKHFLAKPYTADRMLRVVRDCLDEPVLFAQEA